MKQFKVSYSLVEVNGSVINNMTENETIDQIIECETMEEVPRLFFDYITDQLFYNIFEVYKDEYLMIIIFNNEENLVSATYSICSISEVER